MSNIDLILGADHGRISTVRTEPTQRRSTQRLDALLDAAAELVDEVGFERLTTQMVAERAGASIGTVYRYFPDRVAVLHGLRERSIDRYRARVAERLAAADLTTWWELVETAVDALDALYREEPGFTVVHAADRELSDDGEEPEFASRMVRVLAAEFRGIADTAELRFRFGVAMELVEALVYRAHSRDPQGDSRYIDEAKVVVRRYLEEHLDPAIAAGATLDGHSAA
ncbi:TetR/AcrR family transcriptional regulator [Agromyces aerolatus]|uniref:TetR/AcrR family transcriptional regulator n=1 Tax=Agromyces sp. LY-1074 TaxID=3074080 RepID=UPI00285FBDC4|nr:MULTISPECIES: TetR/AcrR family transcriptional regulator [unclassified Agromyces]MDR5700753.1 TetR/AcrR family transcriptional regulator [Agromyces sp. LY-1074]MDR5707274.1 TetR/AcrR family transcriptional regulator [Agromyces sp. LY-1358]